MCTAASQQKRLSEGSQELARRAETLPRKDVASYDGISVEANLGQHRGIELYVARAIAGDAAHPESGLGNCEWPFRLQRAQYAAPAACLAKTRELCEA